MRAVVQRVRSAAVSVAGRIVGRIDAGLLIYLGVAVGDSVADAETLADKIVNLRVFDDAVGVMNRSALEQGGEILAVSQFTLLADARKGRRPSYSGAASPAVAESLYRLFLERVASFGITVAAGVFRADMLVESINDGPITILLDSRKLF